MVCFPRLRPQQHTAQMIDTDNPVGNLITLQQFAHHPANFQVKVVYIADPHSET